MGKKAIYYGQVQIIPNVTCDGYVLDDGTAVLSENATAKLLNINQMALNRIKTTGLPKTLDPFIDKGLSIKTTSSKVVAENSPYKGRYIEVYNSLTIESLIRAYALALAHHILQKNQMHIGERCVILQSSLVRTALEAAIKEACGFVPNIQKTAQKNYIDVVSIIKELGFFCSAPNEIAIKKDIAAFLQVPESTLTYFLHKHTKDIKPISLDRATIKAIGLKAPQLHGYKLEDVAKIAIGMDTSIGIDIKKKMFGNIAGFANIEAKDEIQWHNDLSRVFKDIGIQHNYPIEQYRVDFFIEKFMLVLECNGYSHRYYDQAEETRREQIITEKYGYALVRFHHKISWQALMNGILKAKPGTIVTVYDPADNVLTHKIYEVY